MSNEADHLPEEELGEDNSDEQSEANYSPTVWDYLNSGKGHDIAQQIVTILAQVKNVTIDALAQEKRETLEFQRRVRREQWIVQLVVFKLSLVLVGVLTYVNRFDPAIAVLWVH